MPTLTADEMPADLQRDYRARMATIPRPIPPQEPTMPRFEIRFTYTVNRQGSPVTESDKHSMEAESSPAASRAFNEWFAEAYEGATLRSTSILQAPGN